MNLLEELEKQWDNVVASGQEAINTALPGLYAGLAQNGIDFLNDIKKDSEEQLTSQIKQQLNNPSTPFSSALGNSVLGSLFSIYGGYILLAVVALAFLILYKRG